MIGGIRERPTMRVFLTDSGWPMDLQKYVSATFTVLAVINPVVAAALLMQATATLSPLQRIGAANKASLAIMAILLVASLGGQYLLQAFGISMDVFRIVGGAIIAYLGFLMLSGKMLHKTSDAEPGSGMGAVIMFAASPGTVATVITLAAVHDGPHNLPMTALTAIVLAVAWTWVIMVVMMRFANRVNTTVQRITSEFMGLILITMGLQFVLESYKHFMTG
jgi:multiple antibiotic resistance protein